MKKDGMCYVNNGRAIDRHPGGRLVHGSVVGEGVPRHGHAWIEDEMELDKFKIPVVFDYSLNEDEPVILPAGLYYGLGQAEPDIRYDCDTARKMMLRYGHFGPWEEV